MNAGSVSHPRWMGADAMRAWSRSISHVGKRFPLGFGGAAGLGMLLAVAAVTE